MSSARSAGVGGARRILARRQPELFGYRMGSLGRVLERVARVSEAAREHVHLAWELMRLQDGLEEDEELALMMALVVLLESVEQGSTRLPLDAEALDEQVRPWWTQDEIDAVVRLAESGRAATLLGGPDDDRPLVLERGCLYMHRMFVQETRLAAALATMIARSCDDDTFAPDALAEALEGLTGTDATLQLSDEQLRALSTAATAPVCVISGGPGTGKTSIVVSLLRLFLQLGVAAESIALCAPTGKAAHRLAGSIGSQVARLSALVPLERQLLRRVPAPRTLHRLLGWSPGEQRFRHDAHRPLQVSLVVVDEASMVDLDLMEHLVRALGPRTRLVLLGDAEQLPSVEAGAVLRDLIPQEGDTTHPLASLAVRLTRSYRMDPADPHGRRILAVASQIVAGQTAWLEPPATDAEDVVVGGGRAAAAAAEEAVDVAVRRARAQDVTFAGVELVPGGSSALGELLERWFERISSQRMLALAGRLYAYAGGRFDAADTARIQELLEAVEAARVLCLTRVGPRGTHAVNARLHGQMLARLGLDNAPAFVPGEPLMMLRNDYDKGLFNGDTGLVLRVALEHEGGQRSLMAVFPRATGELGVFHLDALRGFAELAYAITVHKSQGSEYRDVLLVLPERDGPLATREMLYTAVTRARRSVVVAGDEALLGLATLRRVHRWSGITERLVERTASP